jgi:hypothetical protein
MSRRFLLSIAIALALLPAMLSAMSLSVAAAAPRHPRHIYKWHGYGFLPGYHQPPNNSVPIYSRGPGGGGTPDYTTPQYWYGGSWYYFGNPGFLHSRYNGGSFGQCWTSTPIGLMWNCG